MSALVSPGSSIHPTHTCFDDAMDFVTFRLTTDRSATAELEQSLRIVHAICLAPEGPSAGRPFAHAWVEETRAGQVVVWQDGFVGSQRVTYSCDAADFHAQMRVQVATKYTLRQAAAENRRTKSYGPWEEQYRTLCNEAEEPELFADAQPRPGLEKDGGT